MVGEINRHGRCGNCASRYAIEMQIRTADTFKRLCVLCGSALVRELVEAGATVTYVLDDMQGKGSLPSHTVERAQRATRTYPTRVD